jgi:uncharacterized protein
MRRFLQALPPTVEFVIVVSGAFGLLIIASLQQMIWPRPTGGLSDASLHSVIGYELVVLVVLLAFLRVRGWTLERIGIRITARDTFIGLGFVLAIELFSSGVLLALAPISPRLAASIADASAVTGTLGLTTVLIFSVVNPIFEELFVCGYVVSALRGDGDGWTAINVSVAIRLLYHLYQGPAAAIGIVPFGLILAFWYARTRRLWPALTAHAVANFVDLARFVVW